MPGELNAADLPSRGCEPVHLIESRWWLGPSWLYEDESKWPSGSYTVDEETLNSETKKTAFVQMINSSDVDFRASKHFKSYTNLLRFLAWIDRFLQKRRLIVSERKTLKQRQLLGDYQNNTYLNDNERKSLSLSNSEIRLSESKLLKHLQKSLSYSEKEKLSSFKTSVNKDGLLVVRTKISNREDSVSFLNPVLLDDDGDIVRLLVRETH